MFNERVSRENDLLIPIMPVENILSRMPCVHISRHRYLSGPENDLGECEAWVEEGLYGL